MSPYDSATSAGSSSGSSASSASKPAGIDGLLAGVGYHVAQRLERLETAMVNSPAELSQFAPSDTVHYNPSNTIWILGFIEPREEMRAVNFNFLLF